MLSWDSGSGKEDLPSDRNPAGGGGAAALGPVNKDSNGLGATALPLDSQQQQGAQGPGLGHSSHMRKSSIAALFSKALSVHHPRNPSAVGVVPAVPAIAPQGKGQGPGQGSTRRQGLAAPIKQQSITNNISLGTGMAAHPHKTPLKHALAHPLIHRLTHLHTLCQTPSPPPLPPLPPPPLPPPPPPPLPAGILHALSMESRHHRGGPAAAAALASHNHVKRNSRDRDHVSLRLGNSGGGGTSIVGVDTNCQHWKTHFQWCVSERYPTLPEPVYLNTLIPPLSHAPILLSSVFLDMQ